MGASLVLAWGSTASLRTAGLLWLPFASSSRTLRHTARRSNTIGRIAASLLGRRIASPKPSHEIRADKPHVTPDVEMRHALTRHLRVDPAGRNTQHLRDFADGEQGFYLRAVHVNTSLTI